MAQRKRRRGHRALRLGIFLTLLAAVIAAAIFVIPDYLRAQTYPDRYHAEIVAVAEHMIDPAYVAAVTRTESGFRQDARSGAGAMGLMQIMPETGAWIAHKLGEEDAFAPESLYDAALNLRYGTWYLAYLLARYQGDMALATAAYHAGQGMVDRWLADPACSADGQTIACYPDDAPRTENYVKKVLKAYEYYTRIYP